jgi:hypothetical protein
MKNFKQWLLSQGERDDPVGDLARELRSDYLYHKPDELPLPKRLTAGTLLTYLENRHACDGALRALDEATSEYASYRALRR